MPGMHQLEQYQGSPAPKNTVATRLPVSRHELAPGTSITLAGAGCVIRTNGKAWRLDASSTRHALAGCQASFESKQDYRFQGTGTTISGDALANLCADYQTRRRFIDGTVKQSAERIALPILPATSLLNWPAQLPAPAASALRLTVVRDRSCLQTRWDLHGFGTNSNVSLDHARAEQFADNLMQAIQGRQSRMARPFDGGTVQITFVAASCLIGREAAEALHRWCMDFLKS